MTSFQLEMLWFENFGLAAMLESDFKMYMAADRTLLTAICGDHFSYFIITENSPLLEMLFCYVCHLTVCQICWFNL